MPVRMNMSNQWGTERPAEESENISHQTITLPLTSHFCYHQELYQS